MALYLGSNKKEMISGLSASSGVQLPTLTNEGSAIDLLAGKQLIDSNGNIVLGVLVPSAGDVEVEITTTKLNSNGTSISFTGLKGEPSMFSIHPTSNITLGSTRFVTSVTYDGATTHGIYGYRASSSATSYYSASYFTWTYSNGTLTVRTSSSTNGGNFSSSVTYQLAYVIQTESSGGVQLPTLTNAGVASDLAQGKQLIGESGSIITGTMADNGTVNATLNTATTSYTIPAGKHSGSGKVSISVEDRTFTPTKSTQDFTPSSGKVIRNVTVNPIPDDYIIPSGTKSINTNGTHDVSNYASVTVNIASAGGSFTYPDGAFVPVTSFTDGKQYALVAVIDGAYRYINTTTYNNYTMNATQISIAENAGDYVIFSSTPALFTAVASGDGFLLQNGSNYLHGTTSSGTALRVGTTQAVWTVDNSATGGFSDGKYYPKEDAMSVWLFNNASNYNWSIKYETAGSFGYDRNGRDNTYSTGFISFVLYEYVGGEGTVSPIVDTSDANVTADQMLYGASGYAKGKKVTGSIQLQSKTATTNGTVSPDAGCLLSSVIVNVPAGGSSGFVTKSGTTTSATINTGLSDVEQFFMYKESQTGTGLIHLHYTKSATSRMYASAWSTNNYGTKNITNGTGGVTVSNGTVTISATQAAQGALTSGVTYKWIAVGTE